MAILDADDLTACEPQLVRAAETGELVDLRTGESAEDNPSTRADWAWSGRCA
jgi:hypothetical protein